MLSLGGVVGPNGWWSVFIMCVWGSRREGALGHWHGNSQAITPAAPRSDWCSYMGHRRLQRSHRYGWKVGSCLLTFSLPPLWVSWRKERKEAQHVAAPRANVLPLCVLLFLSDFLPLAFQSTAPSSILFLSGRLVNSLSPRLSGSTTLSLFYPNILSSSSKKTSGIPFFLSFFFKGRLLCTNTVQTRLPSVLSPFETPCSLNTTRLKRMPSAFSFTQSLKCARTPSLAFSHIHKHRHIRLTIASKYTCMHTHLHQSAVSLVYRDWVSLPLWSPSFHVSLSQATLICMALLRLLAILQ